MIVVTTILQPRIKEGVGGLERGGGTQEKCCQKTTFGFNIHFNPKEIFCFKKYVGKRGERSILSVVLEGIKF